MKPFPLLFAVAALLYLILRWRKLEPESKGLVALLAAGLAVYGTGVVEIPNLETALEDVGGSLGRWTYLLVARWPTRRPAPSSASSLPARSPCCSVASSPARARST